MADKDGNKLAKEYHLDIPAPQDGFYIKGMANHSFGLKNRLSRMFQKKSGNSVMLAFDHGYIMGSTAGLERLDLAVPPLMDDVDVLMGTRGAIASVIPAHTKNAICLRTTYDASVVMDDMSMGGGISCDVENALNLNASCMAVQTFIGAPGERNSLELLSRTIDAGTRYGIPTLGVVAVGKQMARDTKFFLLATRILAETGAHIIKSYYCEDFEKVAAACPVPIVIAGGKKVPEAQALEMAYMAINQGAKGVDMGRNIFQAESPLAMTKAIGKVVHENFTAKEAYEYYLEMKNTK